MIEDRPDILAAASTDWDGFWFQRQVIASGFARRGHRVFYFNRTLQRRPRFRHFKRPFLKSSKRETLRNPRPDNLRVVTLIWLPPVSCLRPVNRLLVHCMLARLDIKSPMLIADVPTYSTLDLIGLVRPPLYQPPSCPRRSPTQMPSIVSTVLPPQPWN